MPTKHKYPINMGTANLPNPLNQNSCIKTKNHVSKFYTKSIFLECSITARPPCRLVEAATPRQSPGGRRPVRCRRPDDDDPADRFALYVDLWESSVEVLLMGSDEQGTNAAGNSYLDVLIARSDLYLMPGNGWQEHPGDKSASVAAAELAGHWKAS